MSKKEKLKSKVISFTSQRKNSNDKLFDLIQKNTKVEYVVKKVKTKIKSGKNKGKTRTRKQLVVVRKGKKELAKKIGITTAQLTRFSKHGVPDKYSKKIQKQWKKGKFKANKKVTKEYQTDAFTKENFFKPKKIRRLYKHERYYFRCGIYLECKSNAGGGKYIINNLPIPVGEENIQAKNYMSGFNQMFEEIKRTLQKYPSILLWRINYFDVHIVDITKPTLQFKKGKNNKTIYGKK